MQCICLQWIQVVLQHSTAQHSNSTVEESRFRAILGFSKLLIIQTPGGGGGGGLPYFK